MKTTSLYHRLKQKKNYRSKTNPGLANFVSAGRFKNMISDAGFQCRENNMHGQVSIHGCHQLTKSEPLAGAASASFHSVAEPPFTSEC
jgi:hypothetical protein